MKSANIKISDSELKVMQTVWKLNKPVRYSEIREELTTLLDWSSPTINTLVNRLVKKGYLYQEKKVVYYYTPTLSEKEYNSYATSSFLEKVYSNNAKDLIFNLVSNNSLSEIEFNEIAEYWREVNTEDE